MTRRKYMLWIGLTGGIASGKSTTTKFLRSWQVPVICADELAREVVQAGTEAQQEVLAEFGPKSVLDSGELNRVAIAAQVFGHPEKLRRLEEIIHPRVRERAAQERQRLQAQGQTLAFYDVPLLFEKNMQPMFDASVVVYCSDALQLQRLMQRDQLSHEDAQKRLKAQMPLVEKIKRADYVMMNEGDLQQLEQETQKMLMHFRTLALAHQAHE